MMVGVVLCMRMYRRDGVGDGWAWVEGNEGGGLRLYVSSIGTPWI